MKRILIALILIQAMSAQAQITLTAATSDPLPGDTMMRYSLTNVSPGNSGPSVTWNFSTLSASDKDTLYYNPVGGLCSVPEPLYATKNVNPCVTYVYSAYNDSLIFGLEMGFQYQRSFSDPRIELIYPLTYNQPEYLDSFIGAHMSSGSDFDILGWEFISADAYGTLMLPDSTYSNVLRVKKVITTGMKLFGSASPYSYTGQEVYEWYSADHRTPLLKIGQNINLGIAGAEGTGNEIIIYPDPANDQVTVDMLGVQAKTLSVTDITGKTVIGCVVVNKGRQIIDVSNLAPGLYLLNLETDKGTIVRKVQVN